jgi:hypothetical protein
VCSLQQQKMYIGDCSEMSDKYKLLCNLQCSYIFVVNVGRIWPDCRLTCFAIA